MKISDEVIQEVKARTDLAELIASYGVEVKLCGRAKKACCPFHKEKTPSFNINVSKGFYHCFGCGESGDAIKFVQKMEGLDFVESVKKLAERCGVVIVDAALDGNGVSPRKRISLDKDAEKMAKALNESDSAAIAREYLKSRDIDDEAVKSFRLGYGGNDGFFAGRIVFPIVDHQGKVCGFSARALDDTAQPKYINSAESETFKKGRLLYGADRAFPSVANDMNRTLIICEGQFDVIRCHAAGIVNAVAGLGTALTEEHAALIKRHADSVVLAYDGDVAGNKAVVRAGNILVSAGIPVLVAEMPKDEDPDTVIRYCGAGEFKKLVTGAVSLSSFEARYFMELAGGERRIDTVSLVAGKVMEAIARCPSAVQQSMMLADLADSLGIGMAVVEADFRTFASVPNL